MNPVKIDPIFDMDLETKARGVTVNIAISGTMQKLNVNYSSDPPMQPREIIALLAVGRAPTDISRVELGRSSTSSTSLAEAGGGLIGEAITAQLSSRLQRFFGASRVKIDPTMHRRRISAASAPDRRAAGFERITPDLHHESQSHGGTDRADRVGFQPALVRDRGRVTPTGCSASISNTGSGSSEPILKTWNRSGWMVRRSCVQRGIRDRARAGGHAAHSARRISSPQDFARRRLYRCAGADRLSGRPSRSHI